MVKFRDDSSQVSYLGSELIVAGWREFSPNDLPLRRHSNQDLRIIPDCHKTSVEIIRILYMINKSRSPMARKHGVVQKKTLSELNIPLA